MNENQTETWDALNIHPNVTWINATLVQLKHVHTMYAGSKTVCLHYVNENHENANEMHVE